MYCIHVYTNNIRIVLQRQWPMWTWQSQKRRQRFSLKSSKPQFSASPFFANKSELEAVNSFLLVYLILLIEKKSTVCQHAVLDFIKQILNMYLVSAFKTKALGLPITNMISLNKCQDNFLKHRLIITESPVCVNLSHSLSVVERQ